MMEKIDYDEFPATFLRCFNKECPQAITCLRYQLALRMPEGRIGAYAISPFYLEKLGGQPCPQFVSDEPQKFAFGITYLYDDLPRKKAEAIHSRLIAYFGRSTYYRCKQKRRLIKPKEQAYIQVLFRAEGIEDEPRYDGYKEYYDLG